MKKTTKSNTTTATVRKDCYQMVTDRIVKQLENGIIPWQRPWICNPAYNRVTKTAYSPLNQMLLDKSGEYATFKQWQEAGGRVKKGAKSQQIVFWKMLPVEVTDDNGNVITGDDGKPVTKTIPYLKYSNVFHVSQVDGVEPLKKAEENTHIFRPIPTAEKLAQNYSAGENIIIKHGKDNAAAYSPSGDYIQMPLTSAFKTNEGYYATLFHEMTHSTGHQNRLNRQTLTAKAMFGSRLYSKEELVAEMGSAYICDSIGIATADTEKNNAAYCQNWIAALKGDKHMIVTASTAATKAAEYILKYMPSGDDTPDPAPQTKQAEKKATKIKQAKAKPSLTRYMAIKNIASENAGAIVNDGDMRIGNAYTLIKYNDFEPLKPEFERLDGKIKYGEKTVAPMLQAFEKYARTDSGYEQEITVKEIVNLPTISGKDPIYVHAEKGKKYGLNHNRLMWVAKAITSSDDDTITINYSDDPLRSIMITSDMADVVFLPVRL